MKKLVLTSTLLGLWLCISAFASPTQAAELLCEDIYKDSRAVLQFEITQLNESRADKISAEALSEVFKSDVVVFENRLLSILQNHGAEKLSDAFLKLYESLYFPRELIEPRVQMGEAITRENILAVLGDLSAQETLRLFVGPSPKEISPDSLLGKYIAESGVLVQERAFKEIAAPVYPATGQPGFPAGPPPPPPVLKEGPSRLFIPVDEKTFPIFKKYFTNQQSYSVQGHANLFFNGNIYANANPMSSSAMGFLRGATPLPLVLLKTTEGSRLERYTQAMSRSYSRVYGAWGSPARAPWYFMKAQDGSPYLSQKGNFDCCTHWQGNIPIGDNLVEKIILPGPKDQPVVAEVKPAVYNDISELYVQNVWTYPMREPVSSVLGLAENNGRGEFASPGWVIQSLLVSAPLERVPIVFIFTADAKVPVDPAIQLNIEYPR